MRENAGVVMRDDAGENKSQEVVDLFIKSMGVKNYFSTSYEQWQNGLPEAAINSVMMVLRTIMVEPGWVVDSGSNPLWQAVRPGMSQQARICTIPGKLMHWESTDVS